ncbi:MAG: hypothetical protein WBQ32_10220 [Ignavibacteriaceae bacterium]
MTISKEKILEKLKNNLFNIIYLILLIALLAFGAKKENTINNDSLKLTGKEKLIEGNGK